jgi:hypothetical protein
LTCRSRTSIASVHLRPVDLLRELLWAEATKLGVAKNLINVPTAIDVADGGIDGEIYEANVSGDGVIKAGITRYQVKTGHFSLKSESDIKAILLKEHSRGRRKLDLDDLQPRVRGCFERVASS